MPEEDLQNVTSEVDDQKLAQEISRNLGFPFQNVIQSEGEPDTPEDDAASDTPVPPEEETDDTETQEAEEDVQDEDETDVLKIRKGFSKKLNKQTAEIAHLRDELKRHADKSKAFDHIFQSADPAKAVSDIKQSLGVQQQVQASPENRAAYIDSLSSRLPKPLIEKFEAPKDIIDLVVHVIEQGLLPSLRPYQAILENYITGQAKTEEETILQKYPSAKQYMAAAKKLSAQTGLSLEKALYAESDGKVVLDQKKIEQSRKVTNGVQTDLPSITRRQIKRVEGAEIDDDSLAAELVEIDRKTGSNRYFQNRLMRRQ
jgi:hypothetical protein